MQIAKELKHSEAPYYLNYMKLFSDEENIRNKAVQELAKLKTAFQGVTYVSSCRWALKIRIEQLTLKNPSILIYPRFVRLNKFLIDITSMSLWFHPSTTIAQNALLILRKFIWGHLRW